MPVTIAIGAAMLIEFPSSLWSVATSTNDVYAAGGIPVLKSLLESVRAIDYDQKLALFGHYYCQSERKKTSLHQWCILKQNEQKKHNISKNLPNCSLFFSCKIL